MRIFYMVEELKKNGTQFKNRRFYTNGDNFTERSARQASCSILRTYGSETCIVELVEKAEVDAHIRMLEQLLDKWESGKYRTGSR